MTDRITRLDAAPFVEFHGRDDDPLAPRGARRVIAKPGFSCWITFEDTEPDDAPRLALPGQADAGIPALFGDPAITYIDAHDAAHGCFAARVERA